MPIATGQPNGKLARLNGWSFIALGVLTVGLIVYLASTWRWLYADEVALRYRAVYWAILAFLSLVGALHFFAAHLIWKKLLIEASDTSPVVLAGVDGKPAVELRGRARTFRVAPEIAGAKGVAYVVHLSSGWYLAVASAGEAVKLHKSKRTEGEA